MAFLRQGITELERSESEWKKGRERLRKSSALFRSYFNMPLHGVAITSPEKRWIEVNDRLCSIMGYSRNEIIRMTWSEMTHPDDLAAEVEQFNRVLSGQIDQYTMDKRFIRKDGKVIWTRIAIGCLRESNGKVDYIVGLMEDITDRKRAEEQTHRQSQLLAAINSVFFKTLTADSEETVANTCLRVAQELTDSKFGFIGKITPEGLFTTTTLSDPGWETCRIPEMQANVLIKDMVIRGIWGQVLLKEQSLIVNDPVSYPDSVGVPEGHPPLISFLGIPLKDKGKVIGMIAMANRGSGYTAEHQEDMEALSVALVEAISRKQGEKALRDSEFRYRRIVEMANQGIWEMDDQFNINYVNRRMAEMLGYLPEEMIGLPITSFMFEEDIPDHLSQRKKRINRNIEVYERRFRHKDGNTCWTLVAATTLYDETGKFTGSFAMFADITEHKRIEKKLQESEEKYRSLASTEDSLYLVDRNCRYLFANENYMGKFGPVRDSFLGRKYGEFHDDEDARGFADSVKYAFATGNSCQDEHRGARSGGYFLRTFSPVKDSEGNITSVTVVSTNITERKKAEEELQQTLGSLRNAMRATIQVLVSAVETRDPYTAGHQIRSADLARAIATEMGLSHDKIDAIRIAGSIHDIGKLSIPAEILSKPIELSENEFSLVKEHSKRGYEILKNIESSWPLAEIVYQHHERMDGSGYPRNLKGEEILIETRVLAVADVVESMASHRPYRPAKGIDAALEEIENNRELLYDADVVDVCLRLFREKGYQLVRT